MIQTKSRTGLSGLLFLAFLLSLFAFPVEEARCQEEEATGSIESKLDTVLPPISLASVEWRDFLGMLSMQTGISFLPSAKITDKVNVNLTQPMTLRQILDDFLAMQGLAYEITPTAIKVMTIGEVPQEEVLLIERIFSIKSAPVEKIREAITPLKSPEGMIIADSSTKQIVVTDTVENLSKMEELIKKLDVETITRIFPIKYVELDVVLEELREVLGGEPGNLQKDVKKNTLIVTDIPETLLRVEQIIEQLDKPTTLRVFKISFADPEEVIKLIEPFLSEEAYVELDERTSQIIIDDIPSRMEKVEEAIRRIDEPDKVVYIEAEIVDLSLNDNMKIGLDWNIGKNVDIESASDLLILEPLINVIEGKLDWTYLQPQNYRVSLEALESVGKANILASPRLLVNHNEQGVMRVGSEEPYSVRTNTRYNNNNNYSGDIFTLRFKEVGITLDVKVKIISSGYVHMDIELVNSSGEFVSLAGVENSGIRVKETEVKSIVTVKDGRTIVLGGLIQEKNDRTVGGIPFLSRIPILGWIFGKIETKTEKSKLLLFITPHIVSIDDPYRYDMTEIAERTGMLEGGVEAMELLPTEVTLTDEIYGGWEYDEPEDSFPIDLEGIEEPITVVPVDIPEEDTTAVVEPTPILEPISDGDDIDSPALAEPDYDSGFKMRDDMDELPPAREK